MDAGDVDGVFRGLGALLSIARRPSFAMFDNRRSAFREAGSVGAACRVGGPWAPARFASARRPCTSGSIKASSLPLKLSTWRFSHELAFSMEAVFARMPRIPLAASLTGRWRSRRRGSAGLPMHALP